MRPVQMKATKEFLPVTLCCTCCIVGTRQAARDRCTLGSDNRPFPSCFEPRYESDASCIVFIVKISLHSYAKKTNLHMKSFALSLAFGMRFKDTRKWPPIDGIVYQTP